MIIEDGTGMPDATSYVGLDEADGYHRERGNGRWSEAGEAEKAAALVRACDWLESVRAAVGRPKACGNTAAFLPPEGDGRGFGRRNPMVAQRSTVRGCAP
jgi:hypothetical protein